MHRPEHGFNSSIISRREVSKFGRVSLSVAPLAFLALLIQWMRHEVRTDDETAGATSYRCESAMQAGG